MNFTPPDSASFYAFVTILAAVILALAVASLKVVNHFNDMKISKNTGGMLLFVAVYLLAYRFAADTHFFEAQPMPRLLLFFGGVVAGALLFSFSKLGSRISQVLPLTALVGFQTFRLPLELILHTWAGEGFIPFAMTWTGQNFDIISGVTALIACVVLFFSKSHSFSLKVAWAANVVGLVLLLNVMRVAVLSSPIPIGWQSIPPLRLAFHYPFVWIGPVCVGGALAGHILLTRRLISSRA